MRFSSIFLLTALVLATVALVTGAKTHFRSAELASQVNSAASTWTAGVNTRFEGASYDSIRRLMGTKINTSVRARFPKRTFAKVEALPDTFDARTAWPNCTSIAEIRDQSACGSCWAFGASEAATDRICIETNATTILHLSADDLTACCDSCGDGCDGGDPYSAWEWMSSTGIVTGGNYDDFSWCLSYPLENCDHHVNGTYPSCSTLDFSTPSCTLACDANTTYKVGYESDKRKLSSAYSVSSDIDSIAAEIVANGPVEAAFTVYEDFLTYKSGVYQYTTGEELGGHAVKILGYGTENGVKYWLVANSWNTQWGDNGYFKILRGADECGIEDDIVAGTYLSS